VNFIFADYNIVHHKEKSYIKIYMHLGLVMALEMRDLTKVEIILY